MKIGLLSDAHGNPLALGACLANLERQRVDEIYFLGDAVGYLPGEADVLRLLRDAGAKCQKGNHEAMLLGERSIPDAQARVYGLDEARARLSRADRAEIESWPTQRTLEIAGRKILLVHGSPHEPLDGYVYPDSDLDGLADLPFDLIAMGNTHRPFTRQVGTLSIVNVGSCGLPRDAGDLLAFAVYDPAVHEAVVYRSRLDPERVVQHFGREAIPDAVLAVLARQPAAPVFGQVVDE